MKVSVQIYSRKIHRRLLNPDIKDPEPQMTESWVHNQRKHYYTLAILIYPSPAPVRSTAPDYTGLLQYNHLLFVLGVLGHAPALNINYFFLQGSSSMGKRRNQ